MWTEFLKQLFAKKCKAPSFFSNVHTHTHTHRDMLTVPAAMAMEDADVQGHFKYSAAWGSPLSVHHILLLTHPLRCTQKHKHTHTHTQNILLVGIHSTHCISLTLASEAAKCLSGENMTPRKSAHTRANTSSQAWSFNEDTIIHVCFQRGQTWMKGMTFEQLLLSVVSVYTLWSAYCAVLFKSSVLKMFATDCWLIFSVSCGKS